MAVRSDTFTSTRSPVILGWVGLIVGLLAGAFVVGALYDFSLFIILLGVAVVLASLVRLELGLMAMLFLVYTRFSDIAIEFHGAPSVAKFFVAVLLAGLLFRWLSGGEKPSGWERPAVLFGGMALIGLGGMFYAADPSRTWMAFTDFIKDAVIAVTIVVLLQRGRTLRWAVWTMIAAGLFLGTITTFQYLTDTFSNNYGGFAQAPILHIVQEVNSHRVAGPIGDPNFYAQIMVALAPLALDRVWNERNILLRLLAVIAFGVVALTVILTFSRGGFLALLFGIGAMLLYRPPRPTTLVVTAILLVAMVPFIPKEYTERISTLTELIPSTSPETRVEPSFRGRTSELMVGWMMFQDHPFFGVGWLNFPAHYLEYSGRLGIDPRLEERDAHNLFIEFAAETGIVGLAVFGFLLFETILGGWKAWKRLMAAGRIDLAHLAAAVVIGLLSYLVAGVFIHNAYPRFLWVWIAIVLALPNIATWAERTVGYIPAPAYDPEAETYAESAYTREAWDEKGQFANE